MDICSIFEIYISYLFLQDVLILEAEDAFLNTLVEVPDLEVVDERNLVPHTSTSAKTMKELTATPENLKKKNDSRYDKD